MVSFYEPSPLGVFGKVLTEGKVLSYSLDPVKDFGLWDLLENTLVKWNSGPLYLSIRFL